MSIQWINKEKNTNAVTIYSNNITLSKQASSFFEDAYGIAIGYDPDVRALVMKKVSKEDIDKKEIDKENVYELTLKPSFGRINSKRLIEELKIFLNIDFVSQVSYKFSAKWNTGSKMLIIDTKEVSKDV